MAKKAAPKPPKWYVYILRDPITQSIRYVGLTGNLKQRYSAHTNPSRFAYRTDKVKWIYSLKRRGLVPVMQEIESGEGNLAAGGAAEARWIQFFRMLRCPLFNLSKGGERHFAAKKRESGGRQTGMRKRTTHFSRQQFERLEKMAVEQGVPYSALLRQAIDDYLALESEK